MSTEVEVYGKNVLGVYSISTFSFFLVFLGVDTYLLGTLLLLHLPTLDPTFDLDLFFDEKRSIEFSQKMSFCSKYSMENFMDVP